MGHSEDDAVHKLPHKNENALAETAENCGIDLIKNIYRIIYYKIDVILVQCPFNYPFQDLILDWLIMFSNQTQVEADLRYLCSNESQSWVVRIS